MSSKEVVLGGQCHMSSKEGLTEVRSHPGQDTAMLCKIRNPQSSRFDKLVPPYILCRSVSSMLPASSVSLLYSETIGLHLSCTAKNDLSLSLCLSGEHTLFHLLASYKPDLLLHSALFPLLHSPPPHHIIHICPCAVV